MGFHPFHWRHNVSARIKVSPLSRWWPVMGRESLQRPRTPWQSASSSQLSPTSSLGSCCRCWRILKSFCGEASERQGAQFNPGAVTPSGHLSTPASSARHIIIRLQEAEYISLEGRFKGRFSQLLRDLIYGTDVLKDTGAVAWSLLFSVRS